MPRTRRMAAAAVAAAALAWLPSGRAQSQQGQQGQLPGECSSLMTESYSTTFQDTTDGFWVQTGSYLCVPDSALGAAAVSRVFQGRASPTRAAQRLAHPIRAARAFGAGLGPRSAVASALCGAGGAAGRARARCGP